MTIDLSHFNAFFFDFDGVILDSLDIKTKAFGELFKHQGEDVSKQVMNYHRNNGGVSRYEKFEYFYKHFIKEDLTPEMVDDLDRQYSQLVVDEVVKAAFVDGAKELLEEINQNGKKCFVISATPQKEIRKIIKLRAMGHLFTDVVGSPKSKGDNLKDLLHEHHLSAQESIFFGDARADYEAAREHHVQFVGIVDKSQELENTMSITKIKNFKNIFSLGAK